MKIQDRSIVKAGEAKKIYNDVASPENNVIHRGLDRRHAMLVSMFPMMTPSNERVIDHLMGLTDEQFNVLCHHEGTTVVLNHAKLDLIEQAVTQTQPQQPQPVEDWSDVDDEDVEDEKLVADLLAS